MASVTKSLKLPPWLAEAAEYRVKALKYQAFNAYVTGLIRYDLMVQGDHSITLPIAQSHPEERDKIDAELLELTKLGHAIRGSFLKMLLRRIGSTLDEEAAGKEIVAFLSEINQGSQEM